MPCCAFAIFVIGQLVWPFVRFRTWMTGREPEQKRDAAVAWRPGSMATATGTALPSRKFNWRQKLAALALLEAALVAGATGAVALNMWEADETAAEAETSSLAAQFDALHAPICRSLGFRD